MLWRWNIFLTCLLMTRGSGTYMAGAQGSHHGGSSMSVAGVHAVTASQSPSTFGASPRSLNFLSLAPFISVRLTVPSGRRIRYVSLGPTWWMMNGPDHLCCNFASWRFSNSDRCSRTRSSRLNAGACCAVCFSWSVGFGLGRWICMATSN